MPGISRRDALRLGTGALVGGAGLALEACAAKLPTGLAGAKARPTATNNPIVLQFQPLIEGGLKSAAVAEAAVMAAFEQSNPGVKVAMSDPAGSDANLKAIAGGHGPDVFWDFHYAPYLEKSALLRLDEFLSRDNVNPDRWSAAQMSTFRVATAAQSGTFALPCFFGTQVYAVNLADFDALHFDHPDPNWTHGEFAATARKLAGTSQNGQRHFGASVEWYQDQTGDGEIRWLFNAFRGAYIDGTGMNLQIASPESVAAGEWVYEELLWAKTAQERHSGATAGEFASGQMSMAVVGNWGLKSLVQAVKPTLNFDFFPFPVFPAGRTAFGTDDFYAISATTKHPELAWQLLKWLSAEPDWQRAQIRLQLLSPALNSLWPEWVDAVQGASPALKGKAVHWFADAATNAYALPPQYFMAGDTAAQAAMGGYISRLHAQQLHVEVAFKEAQDQINPLVAAAAAKAAAQRTSQTGGAPAGFAPPPQSGMGQPAQTGQGLVQVGGGGYTVAGMGRGLFAPSDACVFACLPLTQASGDFVGRLTGLDAGAGGGTPGAGATAGLMVRGDLSDDAPALALEATSAGAVTMQVRPQARQAASTVTAAGAGGRGLPIWLRLQRQGLNWVASVSTDGSAWTPVGTPQPLPVAGCWVGLYASSGGGPNVKATFDKVNNLVVSGAYRIGA